MIGISFGRFLEKSSRAASFLLLLWIIGVFAFYVRARVYLGFWPTPASPDPKILPFEFHHWLLMVAVFPIAWTIFFLPVSWLIRLKQLSLLVRREIVPYLAGWVLVFFILLSSKKNFVTWFLD